MTTDKANEDRERELLAYLRGEMTKEEAASFRARIAADELYAERLEELLLGSGGEEERETDVLSEETQRAILRRSKWRHRLGNAAYTVAISLLVGAVLMFTNGWIGWYLYEDAYRVARDMVHFTQPGLTVGSSGSQIGFLYGEITMELREQVGRDDQNAGTFSISNVFSIISAKPAWTDGLRKERLFFLFPLSAADREE
ncbi:MAG: sigma factor regulator N-terminal domain-containing protein, partial [Brevibacillus sp.]